MPPISTSALNTFDNLLKLFIYFWVRNFRHRAETLPPSRFILISFSHSQLKIPKDSDSKNARMVSLYNLCFQHSILSWCFFRFPPSGGILFHGPYGEALPERGTIFKLEVYNRVGISQVEVYGMVGKSVI